MEHGAQLEPELNQTSQRDPIRGSLKVMEMVWCDRIRRFKITGA